MHFRDFQSDSHYILFNFVDDALEANDLVISASQKYHQLLVKNKLKDPNACLISTSDASASASQNGTAKNTMDELNEIFSSSGSGSGGGSGGVSANSIHSNSHMKPTLNLKPLEPTMASASVNKNGSLQLCI